MFKLKSLERFESSRGTSFVIESPVAVERDWQAIRTAMGKTVEIDGIEYEPLAYEIRPLGRPIRIGEEIAILVKSTAAPTSIVVEQVAVGKFVVVVIDIDIVVYGAFNTEQEAEKVVDALRCNDTHAVVLKLLRYRKGDVYE